MQNNINPSQPNPHPGDRADHKPAGSQVGRRLSLVLIIGGLLFIGIGGWMFYRQYQEVLNPPAPIVTASLADFADIPTPKSPSATPTVAVVVNAADTGTQFATVVIEATPTPELPPPTLTAEADRFDSQAPADALAESPATPIPAPTVEPESLAIEPVDTPVLDMATPTALSGETSIETEPESAPDEGSDAEVLSLADYPLVVVEELPKAELGAPAAPATGDGEAETDTYIPLTRVVAESIKLDADVIEVGWQVVVQNSEEVNIWTVADYAAGWHKNSLLPGQGGNVVLSGHHNVKGEVFRYIVDLEPGAVVTLYNAEGTAFSYTVEDKFIVKDKGEPDAVRQANARWIGPFNDERLTMITCWPYNNNTHRVIIVAKPVDQTQAMSR